MNKLFKILDKCKTAMLPRFKLLAFFITRNIQGERTPRKEKRMREKIFKHFAGEISISLKDEIEICVSLGVN